MLGWIFACAKWKQRDTKANSETPYGVTIAILAAQGLGIGLVNPFVIADRMIGGIAVRPFEPSVHFRALLRPPDGANSRLGADFTSEFFAVRNAFLVAD